MFDNLLALVKQHAGDAIVNNPAIPNERNDEAISATSGSIFDTLKNAVSGGNIGDIVSMFKNNHTDASSGISQQVQGGVIEKLKEKFGLDDGQAGNIAGSLVPNVLQQMVQKTNDPNDSSFDLKGILGSLTGGQGGIDLQGILNKFTGGEDGANAGSGGGVGGLLGKLKGLFGK